MYDIYTFKNFGLFRQQLLCVFLFVFSSLVPVH